MKPKEKDGKSFPKKVPKSDMEVLLKDEIRFKIVIVGDGGVGKSSIVERYLKNTWSETYDPTISVNFDVKTWEEPFFIIK